MRGTFFYAVEKKNFVVLMSGLVRTELKKDFVILSKNVNSIMSSPNFPFLFP